MKEPLKEELEEYREIIDVYAKEAELIVDTDIDGNFILKKEFSEDNIAQVASIRFIKKGYIAVNVSNKRILDAVYNKIVKPIIENGDDVIFINVDVEDRNIGGLIILDTSRKT